MVEQPQEQPQERPQEQPQERTATQRDLWTLYAKAREFLAAGVPYMEVSARINEQTGGRRPTPEQPQGTAGKISGLASLENELGIGDERSRGEKLVGSVLQPLEGLTLGHTGEIAGMAAKMAGGDYAGARASVENRIEEHQEEYPKSSFVGEMAGAMIPAVATRGRSLLPQIGGRGGAAAAGGMATHGVSSAATISPSAGLASRAISGGFRGTSTGAVGGGIYGHGASEPGQRGRGTLTGAGVGAFTGTAVGAALPVAGAIARRGGLGLLSQIPFVGERAANSIRNRISARALANAEIQDAFRQAGVDPQVAAQMLRDMPRGSILADIDPALARLTRVAKNAFAAFDNSEGPVRRVMARLDDRGTRMSGQARASTGLTRPDPVDDVFDAGYKMWETRHLDGLLERNDMVGKMPLEKILKDHPMLMDILRHSEFYDEALFRKTKKVSFDALWDTRQRMQARLMSQMVGGERKAIKAALDEFDEKVMNTIPGFRESQASLKAVHTRKRSYEAGQRLMNKSEFEIKAAWDKLGNTADDGTFVPDIAARRAFREGMMDQMEERLLTVPSGGPTSGQLTSAAGNQSGLVGRMRVLFPEGKAGDDAFNGWVRSLDDEYRWGLTTRALMGNSTTAQQLHDLGLGGYVTTGRALMNEVLSVAFEDPELRRQASKQVGELLFEESSDAAEQLLLRLMEADAMQAMSHAGGTAAGMGGVSAMNRMSPDTRTQAQKAEEEAARQARPPGLLSRTVRGAKGLLR